MRDDHRSARLAAHRGGTPHSGKTTTLTALLDFLPNATRRIFIRGWAETFDFLGQTKPEATLLLANELSSHLPVYLWGPKAVRVFEALRRGYALASTLHADSSDEALAQLVGELGVDQRDLARVNLLMVMRIYATTGGGYARRVVSVHRLVPRGGTVTALPLVTHDERADSHEHEESAEIDLLHSLRQSADREGLAEELERRAEHLTISSRAAAAPSPRCAPRSQPIAASLSPIKSEEIQSNERPTKDDRRAPRDRLPEPHGEARAPRRT